jgi:DNA-binding NtrC family response regulator
MEQNHQTINILIVDDDQDTCNLFSEFLSPFYRVKTATSSLSALTELENLPYQIVITDLVMPKNDGLELIKLIKEKWSSVSIIAISGKASIETAVQAIKLGAEEFIIKPIRDFELIEILIKKILKKQWLLEENKRLSDLLKDDFDRKMIIGSSYHIQSVISLSQKVAPLDTSVLITGETGVGKSLFAKLIHENSLRKDKPFVTVNCGSIPETLLESHLFGHKKGAFTGAIHDKMGLFSEANGGTLFLDEITETSLEFQVKLLRVLETNLIRKVGEDKETEIDVRFLFATNKNIETQVETNLFRKDLYYRINIINLKISPIRERKNDITELAKFFLKQFSEKYQKPGLSFSEQVNNLLLAAKWEGNVRELRNIIEHAVIFTEHNTIMPEDLPVYISNLSVTADNSNIAEQDYQTAKMNFEKKYFQILLKLYHGNVSKVAEASGLIRQNLYPKLKKLKLGIEQFRE